MKKMFEPIVGMLTGSISWQILDNILTAVIVAFFSAVAAWLGKELCVCVKKQIKKRK